MKNLTAALIGLFGVLVGSLITSISDFTLDERASKRALQLEAYNQYLDAQAITVNKTIAANRKIAVYGSPDVAHSVAELIRDKRGEVECQGDIWSNTIKLNKGIRAAFFPDEPDDVITESEMALLVMGCNPAELIRSNT